MALRWWQQRQNNRLHEGAELIRDGILQDLFAVRRMLELAHDDNQVISASSLEQLQALHMRLEHVSNILSPAFSQDSLTLAIQHLLEQWQHRYPTWEMSIQSSAIQALATPGCDAQEGVVQASRALRESTESNPVVLAALEELLILITGPPQDCPSSPMTLTLELSQQADVGLLTVRLGQSARAPEPASDHDSVNQHPVNQHSVNQHPVNQHPVNQHPVNHAGVSDRTSFGYLCQSFQALTGGELQQSNQADELLWQFRWPVP